MRIDSKNIPASLAAVNPAFATKQQRKGLFKQVDQNCVSGQPLLPYPSGCKVALFQERRKRFSVAARLGGQEIWAHTNNTGSMLGLLRPNCPVLLSPAQNPARALAWTLEAVGLDEHADGGPWVGVNTSVPNRFLAAAFRAGLLEGAKAYSTFKAEAVYEESRIDGLFTGVAEPRKQENPENTQEKGLANSPHLPPLWVECKNVTLVEDNVLTFPDAVSARGAKHLKTMIRLLDQGMRCATLYLAQHPYGRCFAPADYIDPTYAKVFRQAVDAGMEVWPIRAKVNLEGIFYCEESIAVLGNKNNIYIDKVILPPPWDGRAPQAP